MLQLSSNKFQFIINHKSSNLKLSSISQLPNINKYNNLNQRHLPSLIWTKEIWNKFKNRWYKILLSHTNSPSQLKASCNLESAEAEREKETTCTSWKPKIESSSSEPFWRQLKKMDLPWKRDSDWEIKFLLNSQESKERKKACSFMELLRLRTWNLHNLWTSWWKHWVRNKCNLSITKSTKTGALRHPRNSRNKTSIS